MNKINTQKLCLHASLLAVLSLSQVAMAVESSRAGAEKAVRSTTGSVGLVASDSDTKGSTSNGTFGLGALITMPIGDLFGASLAGNYSRTTARTSDELFDAVSKTASRPTCRFNNSDGSVTLFARKPSLGRISASYGKGQLSSNCGDSSVFVSTGEDKLGTDYYRLGVEAYLGDFTLGAVHTSTELEDGPKLDSNLLNASWYPIDSVRLTLSGGDLYDNDTYGFEVEHQPDFMGNALGVTLGYSVVDRKEKVGTINFSVVYHFGAKAELKARDRLYR